MRVFDFRGISICLSGNLSIARSFFIALRGAALGFLNFKNAKLTMPFVFVSKKMTAQSFGRELVLWHVLVMFMFCSPSVNYISTLSSSTSTIISIIISAMWKKEHQRSQAISGANINFYRSLLINMKTPKTAEDIHCFDVLLKYVVFR